MAGALRLGGGLATVLALLSAAGVGRANGRFPTANQILFSPSNPDLVIVRATYGMLTSFDRGASWHFLCEDTIGISQCVDYDPALGVTAGGSWVAALFYPPGLNVSTDEGCNWKCMGKLTEQTFVDLVVRPDAPRTVLALASTVYFDDAGSGWRSQVFQSADDGAGWAPIGAPIDPSFVLTTIEVAPSDGHRLYVSGTKGFGPTLSAVLFVSDDDGATWAARSVPLDLPAEQFIYIGGVDPTNADRVYVRTAGDKSRLLVTPNAGSSFSPATLVLTGAMLGFALSPDGSKVYAGSVEDGLFVGDRATLSFVHKSSIQVQCLAARANELWACANQSGGFAAGVSTDDGAHFAARLTPGNVVGPIACAANPQGPLACGVDANASQCSGAPYEQLCFTFGCQNASDASIDQGDASIEQGDASIGEGDASIGRRPEGTRSGCRCAVAGTGHVQPLAAAFLVALASAGFARRRRRPAAATGSSGLKLAGDSSRGKIL
jgi:MYXO-CTERM domain-containing protein